MLIPVAYRGPVSQGFYVAQPIGLAHARLSIIER
jgi:asparagine synthetase B (glutamine-hydrolysing)